jgi:hypothetical protein
VHRTSFQRAHQIGWRCVLGMWRSAIINTPHLAKPFMAAENAPRRGRFDRVGGARVDDPVTVVPASQPYLAIGPQLSQLREDADTSDVIEAHAPPPRRAQGGPNSCQTRTRAIRFPIASPRSGWAISFWEPNSTSTNPKPWSMRQGACLNCTLTVNLCPAGWPQDGTLMVTSTLPARVFASHM